MPDPRLKPSKPPLRRDDVKSVEEGLNILREAIRDLLSRPRHERKAHLADLKARIASMGPALSPLERSGVSARRLRAMERVVRALEEVSERS